MQVERLAFKSLDGEPNPSDLHFVRVDTHTLLLLRLEDGTLTISGYGELPKFRKLWKQWVNSYNGFGDWPKSVIDGFVSFLKEQDS